MAMKKADTTELVEIVRNRAITTSLKVAKVFGKPHNDVMHDIRRLVDDLEGVNNKPFLQEATYTHPQNGQKYPMYYIDSAAFALLMMGFTGKKALQFKLAYIHGFNEVQAMHKETLDGKDFYVADSFEEALIDWFGKETGEKMFEILSKPEPPAQSCVYVWQMNNGTVKIGVTADVIKRLNTIEHSSGLEVNDTFSTAQIDRRVAYKIENACHKTFAAYRTKGEFFTVSFAEACVELKKQLERYSAKLPEAFNSY